jgi:hypothetical protein
MSGVRVLVPNVSDTALRSDVLSIDVIHVDEFQMTFRNSTAYGDDANISRARSARVNAVDVTLLEISQSLTASPIHFARLLSLI